MLKYADILKVALFGWKNKDSSWDPDMLELAGTDYAIPPEEIKKALDPVIRKRYARILAQVYKKATGKSLANPEKHIDPAIGYAISRAANVRPSILDQLNDEDREKLLGWDSSVHNVSPGLIADAVDSYNRHGQEYFPVSKYEPTVYGEEYGGKLKGRELKLK